MADQDFPYGERPEVTASDIQVQHGADGPPADVGAGITYDKLEAGAVHSFNPAHPADAIEVERTKYPYPPSAVPTTLPVAEVKAYDPADDSHVEVVVRVGVGQLILRQEYPTGSRSELDVLRHLAQLAEQYVEEERV